MSRARIMAAGALAIGLGLAAPGPAMSETLKWASQGDVATLDPHALAEGFTLSFLGNVYEGLVRRDRALALEPSLATSWRNVEPTVWRFELRRGVKFQDGSPFTADDVVFSIERAKLETAGVRGMLSPVAKARKVDDHTVEIVTPAPDPILPQSLPNVLIMSKAWAARHDAGKPTDLAKGGEGYANRNANGTGPFRVDMRTPNQLTVLLPYDGWWDKKEHNLTRSEFRPISSDATRLAALLSREVDLVFPVPLQNIPRLKEIAGMVVQEGPELRTIFLGLDVGREELLYASVKGRNPFRDQRVRQAIAHAIDVSTIVKRVMRGAAEPAGLLIGPGIAGFNPQLNGRPAYDPELAKRLMGEAGYGAGFDVTLDCPNDRYVNDEAICLAVAPMLARIGIKLAVNTMSKTIYFKKLAEKDTSFYMLGWTSGTYDAHHPMRFIMHSPDKARGLGSWNYNGYSNSAVDDLIARIGAEFDAAKRQGLIDEAHRLHKSDAAHVPLHQQALAWAHWRHVTLVQRADDFFVQRWVTVRR